MALTRLAIARPVGVAMFYIAIICLGVISFTRLPIDLLPDIAYPKLVVYTSYPSVAPAEVERFVTERVEQQVSTVPGIEKVESLSREGVSLVLLRFAWGTDMDFAALNVREKLDQLRDALPELADRPVVLRTDPRSEPILSISITGSGDLWALKDLSETVFRRRLEQLDGIAQAAVTGGLDREIHVEIDPRRLESANLTLEQVASALAAANASSPSGTIRMGRFRYPLRTLGEFTSVEQIGDVVVGGSSGQQIRLRDVATISDGFRERESMAAYNGREGVGLLVFKESGANTVRVTRDVEKVLDQLRREYPAVQVQVASAQAGFVSGAISNLVQEMVLGALLAFLVLVLFLRDTRLPVAVALAIPISVVVTFALLHAAGVSLNIMSLGGLALGVGMLVDNSIVVIENIFRHREKGLTAAVSGALGAEEVKRAITASTLTTIAVFGPIIYVEGVAGELFGALSLSVAFSLLVSLLVALTLLPAMAARWRSALAAQRRGLLARPLTAFDRQFGRFAVWYEQLLSLALRHRGRTIGFALGLIAVTIPVALRLDRSVLPDVEQGAFRARLELPHGTPLDVTASTARRVEQVLLSDRAVDAVFSEIGRRAAITGVEEDRSGLNTALLDVRLKSGASTAETLARLREQLRDLPPGALSFESGQATALGKLLGGGESDLSVRVRGDDSDAALAYARRLESKLAATADLDNVRLGTEVGQPEVLLEIDRERAAAFGIEPRRVVELIERAMAGRIATQYVDFDRKIPIIVRLPESDRYSLNTLDGLRIDGVPLSELVRAREALELTEIRRADQSRVVPVFADVTSAGIDDAVQSVQRVLRETPAPAGIRAQIGGENEEMRRSFLALALAFGLALALVYMILAAEFESFVHPFTILLAVPLSLIGAVWALWLFGAGINSISLIGAIILVGIVDNDAVVKIDFINQMRREGMSVRDAIFAAGRARLRPIVMNTLTAMLAVLPMMLGFGPGAALQAPLAIVVFGGLLTATALTLIVIPVAYELIDELGVRLTALARPTAGPASASAPASAHGD
ncbi:MAG: efflux RND transporter permease subunit [Gemmatimonadota bacterium]